jgi:hypothetical protein
MMKQKTASLAQHLVAAKYNLPEETAHLINLSKAKAYESYLASDEGRLEEWLDSLYVYPNT